MSNDKTTQPAQAAPMKGALNLSDPAVQKRLAAQWGYVQAPAPAPEATRSQRLRAYGNAINAEAARVFIEAVMAAKP